MLSRTKKTLNLFLLSIVFLASSCVTHYVPSAGPAAGLSEKNEINFNGGFSISGASLGNAQVAYAFTDKIGSYVQYNGFSSEPKVFDSLDQWKRGRYFEIGAGYFKKFGKNSNGLLEIYPSYGQGYIVNQYTETNLSSSSFIEYAGSSRLEYQKITLSTGIGYKNKSAEIYYHLRLNNLTYTSFSSLNMTDTDLKNKLAALPNKNIPIIESVFTIKVGFENFKFIMQAGAPMNYLNNIPNNTPAYIGGGVQLTINKK